MDTDINFEDLEMDEDSDEDNLYVPEPAPEPSPEEIFLRAIEIDDVSKFVAMTNDGFTSSSLNYPQDLLVELCRLLSVGCVSALIKGETRLTVDINSPCEKMNFALHMAALSNSIEITELLLVNNAQTGVRRNDHKCFTLPLHLVLMTNQISELKRWTPKNSINQLLFSLCLPDKQEALEHVGLLAWTTKHMEEEFLRYVEDGLVVEVAALLMVAWKKLRDPVITARIMLSQNEVLVSRDIKTVMLQLFEIFEVAGDDLEAYIKQPKLFVCKRRATTAVKYLLLRKGIHVKHEETDLSYLDRSNGYYYLQRKDIFDYGVRWPRDLYMEHYGKSGYRWIHSPLLQKIDQIVWLLQSSPNTVNTNSPTIDRATSLKSETATDLYVEALSKVKGWRFNLSKAVSSKLWASFASVRKFLK